MFTALIAALLLAGSPHPPLAPGLPLGHQLHPVCHAQSHRLACGVPYHRVPLPRPTNPTPPRVLVPASPTVGIPIPPVR